MTSWEPWFILHQWFLLSVSAFTTSSTWNLKRKLLYLLVFKLYPFYCQNIDNCVDKIRMSHLSSSSWNDYTTKSLFFNTWCWDLKFLRDQIDYKKCIIAFFINNTINFQAKLKEHEKIKFITYPNLILIFISTILLI